MSEPELYTEYKANFGEEWHGAFDLLCGVGKSANIVAASIDYIVNEEKTQGECADEWDTTRVSIGNTYESLIEYAHQQDVEVEQDPHHTGGENKYSVMTDIVELMGWGENDEYSVYRGPGGERSITVRKNGFQQIRAELRDGNE